MIQDIAPLIKAKARKAQSTDEFELNLTDYSGQWVVLVYFPRTNSTELTRLSDNQLQLSKINCQLIAISGDASESHIAWLDRPMSEGGPGRLNIPIISDFNKEIAKAYGCISSDGSTVRATFIISPAGIIRYITMNDMQAGRNVVEIKRLVAAFQYADESGEVGTEAESAREYFQNESNRFSSEDTTDGGGKYHKISSDGITTDGGGKYHRTNNYNESSDNEMQCLNVVGKTKFCFSRTMSRMHSIIVDVLDSYKSALQTAPLQTKALSSLVIALLGELIAASIKARRSKSKRVVLDFRRVACFGIYGLAITGPFFHWWYGYLERTISSLHLRQPSLSFGVKLAVNQLIMTPSFLLFTMLYIQYFLTLNMNKSIETVKRTYAAALFTNWKVWTPAQVVNFTVVPLDYRVLFGNVIALWWNTYLSVTSSA